MSDCARHGSCAGRVFRFRARGPFIIVQPTRPYLEELSQPTGRLRVGVGRTKWGLSDLDPEVLRAIDSTASLLEEMGHSVTEIEPPFKFEELAKIMLDLSDLGASSLETAARAMSRTISADTLEPVSLKLYERGRNLPVSTSTELHEAIRRMRFSCGRGNPSLRHSTDSDNVDRGPAAWRYLHVDQRYSIRR
ncbi:amidase family protein [Mesorhizobium sp.]|uniref:amidase family protein n=1 Tax=Mesorhizobium sp. TaxID=1871066 RepID=UPI0025EAB29B|nr:amidase family protein [Mesorhizobium sp.]